MQSIRKPLRLYSCITILSATPSPSRSDRAITEDLVYACNLVQITVLDHIIIGDNVYFSFADEGLLEEYNRNYVSIKERRGRPNE
ncbi:DNA repair protein RadC [Methanophagales archaeon]|nr:DNA repair protein RadC [Methanophagales archaeon]